LRVLPSPRTRCRRPGPGSSQPRDFQRNYRDLGILFTAGRQNTTGDVFGYIGTTWNYFAPGGFSIPPPLSSIGLANVRSIGSRKIYFCASTPGHDLELHVMDGSVALGMEVHDINAAGGSNPHGFTLLRDTVVFVATDATHGTELWALRNGATERPVDLGCSNSRLDVEDPVLGRDIYYHITTGIPSAAPISMIGWPAQTPFVLPWVSPCPVHVEPGLTTFAFYPAGWHFGTIHVPGDVALNGWLLVMQCYVGSTTGPSAYEFTNPVYLHLGL
jgi:ELWxxDGT repeat protein